MSASLSCTKGKAIAAAASSHVNACCRRASGIRANGWVRRAVIVAMTSSFDSGFVGGNAAEQTGRAKDENQNQDREDDDVGPCGGDELAAHRLDQADDDAAKHGARDVANAAQDGGGEGTQAGGEADDEAGEVVIQTKDK